MSQYHPPKLMTPTTAPFPAELPAVTGMIAVRPPALSSTPDAWGLLKAFRRRWILALCLGIFLASILGGSTYLLVPRAKYTAVATLHIATHPKRIMFEPKEVATEYRIYQKTQTALIGDRKVLAHALAKPEVASLATVREQADPEEWLSSHLKADFPGGSEVLQLTLSGDRAEDLAAVVNAVVKSYMTLVVEEEERSRVTRLDDLRKLREKYELDLKQKRKTLRETASTVGLSDQKAVALTQQYKSEQLALAQSERMATRSDLLKLQARLTILHKQQKSARDFREEGAPRTTLQAPRAVGNPEIETDPRVQQHRQSLAVANRKYQEVSRLSRLRSDPSVARALRLREDAAKNLASVRASVAAELAVMRERRESGDVIGGDGRPFGPTEREQVQGQVDVLQTYATSLDKDIETLQAEVKTFNEGSLDLENEREELSIASEVAHKVGSEVEAVQVELGAPQRIRVLSEAKVPGWKDDQRKAKAGGAAAVAAFAFTLLGISYWEFSTRRIGCVDELVNGLGIRLVGTLPAVSGRPERHGVERGAESERRFRNRLVESVDAMRAVLLHASRSGQTRVVMISSAVQGEGKTSLACHLAGSLARAGRRTLLVDGDLRRPTCHLLLGQPADPGLCEYLRGEAELDDITRSTSAAGLSFMPVGKSDDRAICALSQDVVGVLFEDLRTRYDFVIVDSAPVLPVADSLLVGQWADTVIFSVMREVSRLPQVYSAHERLSTLGVRILGAVIANVKDGSSSYYDKAEASIGLTHATPTVG